MLDSITITTAKAASIHSVSRLFIHLFIQSFIQCFKRHPIKSHSVKYDDVDIFADAVVVVGLHYTRNSWNDECANGWIVGWIGWMDGWMNELTDNDINYCHSHTQFLLKQKTIVGMQK